MEKSDNFKLVLSLRSIPCILPRCVNAKKNNKKQNLHCKIFQYPRSLKKHVINANFVF